MLPKSNQFTTLKHHHFEEVDFSKQDLISNYETQFTVYNKQKNKWLPHKKIQSEIVLLRMINIQGRVETFT